MKVRLAVVLTWLLAAETMSETVTWKFDNVTTGSIPAGWKTMSAFTSGSSPISDVSTCVVKFEVVADATAPGAQTGNKVLKLSDHLGNTVYDYGHTCWTDSVKVANATISADVMCTDPNKGHCGFAFRVKDNKNYYAIRYSLQEGNISFFKVKAGNYSGAGVTKTAGTAIGADVKGANKWVNFKIEVTGGTIKVYLKDVLRVTFTDASPITEAGGVGLFSRGFEPIVSMDNLTVTSDAITGVVPQQQVIPRSRLLKTSAGYSLLGRRIQEASLQLPMSGVTVITDGSNKTIKKVIAR